ncbi:MAG: DUF72 domain-containing protein [Pseudomonadota bacterium]
MSKRQSTLDFAPVAEHRVVAPIYIGCAGSGLPGPQQHRFPSEGTHLERYAKVFPAVEINSSFYRPHRPATYARWCDSVPDGFRFSLKIPRTITHDRKLQGIDEELRFFLEAAGNLGEKLGCLLVQLPPRLQYDPQVAEQFFGELRSLAQMEIVCEPRHLTWFSSEAAGTLAKWKVGRVVADPAIVAEPAPPIYEDTVYIRLHGSPVIYHSSYSDETLRGIAAELVHHQSMGRRVWCIFDNTASGAAIVNALSVFSDIEQSSEK